MVPVLAALLLFVFFSPCAYAQNVLALTTVGFEQHIKDNKQTLVEFYAPWCGHCKKLAPEYEKAAKALQPTGIRLAKVDATEEKDLAAKYNVKGFPTLIWFEDAKQMEYDGGRTAETIEEWVRSMIGAAVLEATPPGPKDLKPQVVLYADGILPGFLEAAKANRRKATWYFQKGSGPKVVLSHRREDPIELTGSSCGDKEKVTTFLTDNLLPLFGPLDGDTWDRYMETSKGLVWALFPMAPGTALEGVEANNRAMMTSVAKNFKGKFYVTFTDTAKFKEAIENVLNVKTFPTIAVQKKTGDKKKYIYEGDMNAEAITRFIADVDSGRAQPKLKSDPEPAPSSEPVLTVVGTTLQREVFTQDKDVFLTVGAPWCGHCKKLEPEYTKLGQKIVKEGLTDLLKVTKIDGTTNDSPVDVMDWESFPTIYFVKAGQTKPIIYDGERTAKGLWKYVKKHATKAQEIRERVEKNKKGHDRAEEL